MGDPASECPVCLEPLEGTIVILGCCRNRVHIQCYVEKCPLCRASLPKPEHVAVPVPVPVVVQVPRPGKFAHVAPMFGALLGVGLVITISYRT
jgi:hypothetical protein